MIAQPPFANDFKLPAAASPAFPALFNRPQELHRVLAVDEAMIVGQRQIHHGADDNLAVFGNGALLNLVHAGDAGLRRVGMGLDKR